MTYLILHKVRGEPAFDIAEPMEVDGERWWIIPTSGHRAYPYWHCKMTDLGHFDFNLGYQGLSEPAEWYPMPVDWPDHYNVTGEKPPPDFNIMTLVSNLMPKIRRRV